MTPYKQLNILLCFLRDNYILSYSSKFFKTAKSLMCAAFGAEEVFI